MPSTCGGTEGTGWFAPEKLTEVIDTYENSQMYLPGKYSKFSDTGSAKPGDKFVKQTPSQYVGNSQNSAAYPRWKTGRSSQNNGTHLGVGFVMRSGIEPSTVRSVGHTGQLIPGKTWCQW